MDELSETICIDQKCLKCKNSFILLEKSNIYHCYLVESNCTNFEPVTD